jgi:hypothetical protein
VNAGTGPVTYDLDEHGRVARTTDANQSGTRVTTYAYEGGLIVREDCVPTEGTRAGYVITRKYNERDLLVKETLNGRVRSTSKFEFDGSGNWVKREARTGEGNLRVTERLVEYHP